MASCYIDPNSQNKSLDSFKTFLNGVLDFQIDILLIEYKLVQRGLMPRSLFCIPPAAAAAGAWQAGVD